MEDTNEAGASFSDAEAEAEGLFFLSFLRLKMDKSPLFFFCFSSATGAKDEEEEEDAGIAEALMDGVENEWADAEAEEGVTRGEGVGATLLREMDSAEEGMWTTGELERGANCN